MLNADSSQCQILLYLMSTFIFQFLNQIHIYSEHYWFSRHVQIAKVAVHIVLSKHGA